MNLSKQSILYKRESAVIGQPAGLLVTLMIAAVIIILLIISIHHLQTEAELHHIEQQMQTILMQASTMFEYANEESQINLQVTFPQSMRFIVFGDFPRNGIIEPIQRTLDENTSNNCYYVTNDGTIRTFHSNTRFSNHNMTQISVFYAGSYTITLKLSRHGGKTYVTMS
jgi:hypothetical protein